MLVQFCIVPIFTGCLIVFVLEVHQPRQLGNYELPQIYCPFKLLDLPEKLK